MTLIDIWTEIVLACDPGISIWDAQDIAERYIMDTYAFERTSPPLTAGAVHR